MATLIVPQVTVFWGDTNLSAYEIGDGQIEPLVYDVQCALTADSNTAPTGSMSWNPSGPGFDKFNDFVSNKYKEKIKVKFWYVDGPEVEFFFYYAGSDISYGLDMRIKVALSATSAFKSTATRSSFSQDKAPKFEDKGQNALEWQKAIKEAYPESPDVQWTDCAKQDAKEVQIRRVQVKDQTYGATTQNLQQQLGNTLFLSNIGTEAQLIAYAPLTYQAEKKCGEIAERKGKKIDPKQRYGYLLGPTIISTFNRKAAFSPPTAQKSSVSGQPKNPTQKKKPKPAPGSNPTQAAEDIEKAQQEAKTSVQTPSSPSITKGLEFSENPNGPAKQEALNEEEGIKLSAQLFLTPSILGIKPQDVVYIPSLQEGNKNIEDYKVISVSYQQSGAEFTVSLEGSRTFGLSKPMWPEESEKFLKKAQSLKTLDQWEQYTWREPLGLPPV